MKGLRWRLTGSVFSSRVGQWTQRGIIKSIQRGTITVANASLTNTATITSVVPGNTRLVYLGNDSVNAGGGGTGTAPCLLRIDLTNATTVTATRLDSTDDAIVSFEVIEYWPGVIRTVQRGTVVATAAVSGTATLGTTLQTVTKATIEGLGWNANTAFSADNFLGRVSLTNTTTVTLNRIGTNNNLTAGFQVVEWF